MKWYGIIAFVALIGGLGGIVINGMNSDFVYENIFFPAEPIEKRTIFKEPERGPLTFDGIYEFHYKSTEKYENKITKVVCVVKDNNVLPCKNHYANGTSVIQKDAQSAICGEGSIIVNGYCYRPHPQSEQTCFVTNAPTSSQNLC